jgi:hypothetical protein
MRFFIDRDRFEAIIAGAAEPKERRSARTALNPIGPRDRLAALGAGIPTGQIAGIDSSHGASPWISGVVTTPRFFKMLMNGTGLLSKRIGFVATSPLHLDCVICTTFLRVRMTQIRADRRDASHAQFKRRTRRGCERVPDRLNPAAMSPIFRHICAR